MNFDLNSPVLMNFPACLNFGHCVAALAGKGLAGFAWAGYTRLSTEAVEWVQIIFLCPSAVLCLFAGHPLAGRAKPRFTGLVQGRVHKLIHKIQGLCCA
jgi:hypothetical protein